ncbi:MAG: threonine/serine dehydratase [Deltaproteobacteria bacterium]
MPAGTQTVAAATRRSISDAETVIRPYIRRTPVVEIEAPRSGTLTLKLELLQHAGSFKTRGAFANLLLRDAPAAGVVAASGGNHGAAVAYAAQKLGVPATIFVPKISSATKVERIRSYAAQLVVTGDSYADALAASEAWAEGRDVMAVHAFDQIETILGAGTVGLELQEQVPDADTVLVPVGGGGLLAGIASAYGRRVRLIGVEPIAAPTLTRALAAGHPIDAEAGGIAADSLGPRRVGEHSFRIVQPIVERTIVVADDDIRAAQRRLWDVARIVAEPGGAASFAALLSGAYTPRDGERVVVIVSGGNTTAVDFDAPSSGSRP